MGIINLCADMTREGGSINGAILGRLVRAQSTIRTVAGLG
jgi:hypothetical protein